jgi:hypothetical protein
MAIDQRDVSSTLRFMDDRALQQYAAMHKNDPYIFPLAFQESQNRQKLRMSQQGAQGMQPQPKVADQALAQMAPQQLPEDVGIGALPAGNMQFAAEGGIMGYEGYDEGPSTFGQEPVMMMAEGGHVPRYQGNPRDGSLVRGPYAAPTAGVMGDIPGYVPGATPFMPQEGAPEELPFFQRQLAAAREQGRKYQLSQAQARITQGVGTASDYAILADEQRKADASAPPTRRADFETPSTAAEAPATAPAPTKKPAPTGNRDAAPRPDTTRKPVVGAPATTPAAVTDPSAKPETGGLDTLMAEFKRNQELALGAARNADVQYASKLREEARKLVTDEEKRIKDQVDPYKDREARLLKQEKGLEGMGDKYLGLALLQAGAAMMTTPGSIGVALGKGVQVGSERYIQGMEKINAAKDKFAEARDRLDDLRLNRADMNARDIKAAKAEARSLERQAEGLFYTGAREDLKMTNQGIATLFAAAADNLKTDKTLAAEATQTDKRIKSTEKIATLDRDAANARANMLPSEARTAMLLGTGTTDKEKYESGLKRVQELTADKTGMAAFKILGEINAKNANDPSFKPLTLADLTAFQRDYQKAMRAGPANVSNKPTGKAFD